MTTIIINEKTKKGKLIIDLIREMNCGTTMENDNISKNTPNDITRLSIKEAREGKTTKCLDLDDYLAKVK